MDGKTVKGEVLVGPVYQRRSEFPWLNADAWRRIRTWRVASYIDRMIEYYHCESEEQWAAFVEITTGRPLKTLGLGGPIARDHARSFLSVVVAVADDCEAHFEPFKQDLNAGDVPTHTEFARLVVEFLVAYAESKQMASLV